MHRNETDVEALQKTKDTIRLLSAQKGWNCFPNNRPLMDLFVISAGHFGANVYLEQAKLACACLIGETSARIRVITDHLGRHARVEVREFSAG